MSKYINVHTNDPAKKMVNLIIAGPVEKFVTIKPRKAHLYGKSGKPTKAVVSIIQEKKYPFRIMGPTEHQEKNFRYTISKLDTSQNQGYLVTFENLKQERGRYYKILKLKTDSPIRPEIVIPVWGYISE